MTARRSLTSKRKREIAAFNGWRTRLGETVVIEEGEIVTLHDGRKVEHDHAVQLALGGSDEIENMQPMTPAAHTEKSKRDAKARAKVRHLTGANKPKWKRSWPKGRSLRHPFLKKMPDGAVVRR